MNQIFSKIWIVVIALFLIVGGVFAWQYFGTSKGGVKTLEDETADWKTYRNERYGFALKYPEIFNDPKSDASIPSRTEFTSRDFDVTYDPVPPGGSHEIVNVISGGEIVIAVNELPGNLLWQEWAQLGRGAAGFVISVGFTQMGEREVYRVDSEESYNSKTKYIEVRFPDPYKYPQQEFYFLITSNTDNIARYEQILSGMISTFQFTESHETADWKIYRNEEFGFEFKYPAELETRSSGPNEEQKKLERGEAISRTVPPSYDTIAFSDSVKKEQFNVVIFPVKKDEISSLGFMSGYLSMGSVCDTRWIDSIDSISEGPTLLNKNGIPVLAVQVISGGLRGGSSAGCYYFKNSGGNLVVFNISGFEQKSDFLNVFHLVGDKILSTFKLLKRSETNRTEWKEYALEEITKDFESQDFMDRRLIGIRDNGQKDTIVPSMRVLMGWERVPREAGFYPRMVSAPSYSWKIFFVKYLAGLGHSAGLFELDVKNLSYRKLPNTGEIYENYLNYKSVVSPDGLRIASLGGDNLYVLDLLEDRAKILVKAQPGEVFFAAQEVPDFKWIDNVTIQYPVSSSVDFAVIAIKQISVGR